MNDSPDTRQLLLAYLLKELSDDDRRAVEERLLAEQQFSDQMQEAEYDMMDDYRAGRLTVAERRRAEAALSPQRLAQSLSSESYQRVVRPSSNIKQRPTRAGWSLRWSLAAVTLAICIAGGCFLFHLETKQRPLPQTAQRAGSPKNADQPSMPHAPEGETTAVLLLASDVMRGPAGPTLELHPFTRVIEVEWVVPADSSVQNLELSVSANSKILSKVKQDGLLRNVDGKRVAIFHLAPSVFTGDSADSHFLFIIGTDGVPHAVSPEFAVLVSRR